MYKQKAKMKQNKILKGSRGITLIALVITIIVLLILAAVSIATLTGDNGILTKAGDARDKTNKANAVEQAQTDILGYQAKNQNGEITTKQLKDVLSKYFESVPEEDELENKLKEEDFKLKSKPEYGGQEIEISDIYDGSLTQETEETFNAEELTIGAEKATNTDKYGWKVKNYKVPYKEGTTEGVWRLFYQDKKYTYLITDELAGNYRPSDFYEIGEKYLDGTKMSIVGRKLNGRVSSLFTAESSQKANANIRATVWFTDTDYWSKYKDTNGDAEFCIASPTAELFEASYNNNTNATHNPYKNNKIDVQLKNNYGYSANTDRSWLNEEDSHGIYLKGRYWWLASPGDNFSEYCLTVSDLGRCVGLYRRGLQCDWDSPYSLFSNI